MCRQVAKAAVPALSVAARKLHVSSTQRAAEISTILEERILGAAPKVTVVTVMLHKLKGMIIEVILLENNWIQYRNIALKMEQY